MKVIIGLGSNLGNGRTILQEAWAALGSLEGITLDKLSSPYSTAPVGMTSQHWFTNAAGSLRVTLSPLAVLAQLLAVESRFGRTRHHAVSGYQDRSLDLDMLFYGDIVMDSPELILPHPRIGDRLFVLAPLVEVEPGFRDVVSGKTITEMDQDLRQRIVAGTISKQEILRCEWNDKPIETVNHA